MAKFFTCWANPVGLLLKSSLVPSFLQRLIFQINVSQDGRNLAKSSTNINESTYSQLSAKAVNASAKYMVWPRDHPPSAGKMKSASLHVINALAGTGMPDAFRPYVDPKYIEIK